MARMSIDDRALRDPRILRLARAVGWSRRETIGALLDVWAVCYDRQTPQLLPQDIDIAAEHDGFCAAMVEVELARPARGNRLVHVCGVKDRIQYLASKREAGRVGGLKSAETRGSTIKHTGKHSLSTRGSSAQAIPSAIPNASASASAPDSEKKEKEKNSRLSRAGAREGGDGPHAELAFLGDAPESPQEHVEPVAASLPQPTPKVSAGAKPERMAGVVAPGGEHEVRMRLGTEVWEKLNHLRCTVASRYSLAQVGPLHPMSPGRTELANRLRESQESGRDPASDANHVLSIAEAEAHARGDAKYLGAGMFERVSWYRKLELSASDVKADRTKRTPSRPEKTPAIELADRFLERALAEEQETVRLKA
jgi:hypothetical protein